MTRRQMEAYRNNLTEIQMVKRELDRLLADKERIKKNNMQFGLMHMPTIGGLDMMEQSIQRCRGRMEMLGAENAQIEREVDAIEDPVVRQALTLYYLQSEGSWGDVAVSFGHRKGGNSIEKAVSRYFQKCQGGQQSQEKKG